MGTPQNRDRTYVAASVDEAGAQVRSADLNKWQDQLIANFRGKAAVITPSAITGNVENYDPTGLDIDVGGGTFLPAAQVIRQDLSGNVNLRGLARGVAGRVVYLVNIDPDWHIDLEHEAATSTAANRLTLPGGVNRRLYGVGSYAKLWYDGTSSRWRVLEVHTEAGDHGPEIVVLNIFGGQNDSGDAWAFSFASGILQAANGSSGLARHAIGIQLPAGTIIDELHATVLGNAGGTLDMSFCQGNVGGKTTHDTDTTTASGTAQGLAVTGLNVLVEVGENYFMQLEANDSNLGWALFEAYVVVHRPGKNET